MTSVEIRKKFLACRQYKMRGVNQIEWSLDHIARRDSTQQNCFVELSRVGRCDHSHNSFWSNFRPVGASLGVLNISELVEDSRRKSGDMINLTTGSRKSWPTFSVRQPLYASST